MGHQDAGNCLPPDEIERLLWSARRAGTMLIIPRGDCARAIDALASEGFVRRQLGHIVLTPKGQERRRRCTPQVSLRA